MSITKKELKKDAQKAKNEIAIELKKLIDGTGLQVCVIEDCLLRIEKYVGKGATTSNFIITNKL